MIDPQITEYVERLMPERSLLLHQLEEQARAEEIPIMQLPAIQMVCTLLVMKQPKRILEIGTAIGYSTIWLAQACPHARITTMEKDRERVSRALENLEKANVRDRVEVIEGDAREGLPDHYKFDFMLFDAAKGESRDYFDLYFPYLEDQGVLVCDNALFKGLVASDEEPEVRFRAIVRELKVFNEFLCNHPRLHTTIATVGDGLSISVKRGEQDEETGTAGNGSGHE